MFSIPKEDLNGVLIGVNIPGALLGSRDGQEVFTSYDVRPLSDGGAKVQLETNDNESAGVPGDLMTCTFEVDDVDSFLTNVRTKVNEGRLIVYLNGKVIEDG